MLILVFWRNQLYGPRELREGAGRVVSSVVLVAVLSLVFAVGTGQHFTTFGLYVVAATLVASLIAVFRWSYETSTRSADAVARRAPARAARRRSGAGGAPAPGAGREPRRDRLRVRRRSPLGPGVAAAARRRPCRRADRRRRRVATSSDCSRSSRQAHRRGVKVRIAPRTTELLVERGEYVPGQAVPLFELRPPVFAGADWAVKRAFDSSSRV